MLKKVIDLQQLPSIMVLAFITWSLNNKPVMKHYTLQVIFFM